jgi:hypothetical protein
VGHLLATLQQQGRLPSSTHTLLLLLLMHGVQPPHQACSLLLLLHTWLLGPAGPWAGVRPTFHLAPWPTKC